jgi:dTDP-4-dehydrorhamnose reductase
MKILVTGGSGFLGRRTAAYLNTLGWQVWAPGHGELDITEETAVESWFRAHRPDAVIHTAAVSDTALCQQKPEWSERINVNGSVHLAKACRSYGGKLLICSSDQVYAGSPLPGPHRESEAVTPGNVYGGQKLRAERECLDILPETVCLRLSWMYAGADYPGQHSHFLAALKAALADETKPISWPVHDRRGLTDVEIVVKNLPAALELPGGVWNFGSENDRSTYDTVKAVLEELNMEKALQRLQPNWEAFAAAPRDISMDISKLKAAGIEFPTTAAGLIAALKG